MSYGGACVEAVAEAASASEAMMHGATASIGRSVGAIPANAWITDAPPVSPRMIVTEPPRNITAHIRHTYCQ